MEHVGRVGVVCHLGVKTTYHLNVKPLKAAPTFVMMQKNHKRTCLIHEGKQGSENHCEVKGRSRDLVNLRSKTAHKFLCETFDNINQ